MHHTRSNSDARQDAVVAAPWLTPCTDTPPTGFTRTPAGAPMTPPPSTGGHSEKERQNMSV
eukprot:15632-Eustigmatos_ZCMA.PRE.1